MEECKIIDGMTDECPPQVTPNPTNEVCSAPNVEIRYFQNSTHCLVFFHCSLIVFIFRRSFGGTLCSYLCSIHKCNCFNKYSGPFVGESRPVDQIGSLFGCLLLTWYSSSEIQVGTWIVSICREWPRFASTQQKNARLVSQFVWL